MTADGPFDLGDLTLAVSRSLVGDEFVRRNPGGPDVRLRLVAADRARRDPTADPEADRPFSLLFAGPLDPSLTQGRHDLEHPRLPLVGIFLVRVQGEPDAAWYEAVFG